MYCIELSSPMHLALTLVKLVAVPTFCRNCLEFVWILLSALLSKSIGGTLLMTEFCMKKKKNMYKATAIRKTEHNQGFTESRQARSDDKNWAELRYCAVAQRNVHESMLRLLYIKHCSVTFKRKKEKDQNERQKSNYISKLEYFFLFYLEWRLKTWRLKHLPGCQTMAN